IVYATFRGLFADNPRAIYEAIAADPARADVTHTWLCNEKTRPTFPAGVQTVIYPSDEAAAALGAADVVVANDCMSMQWEKKPGAFYLQTWHGTPLKKIHHDAPLRPGWLDNPDKDVARWDLLLSQNPLSTDRLSHAFRFPGPVRETGYPRNDVMSGPHRDDVRARVRAELGIPAGTTAVLYAPTWRDDLVFDHVGDKDFEVPIDLAAFTERLGADHVLLTRLHSMVAGRIAIPPGAPVVDVSDRAESAELYLAADMLVTDYSSAMFDFAVTGKPMVFFTYDLEHYRDDVRGFYFDLAEVAPGPLVFTSEDVIAAIAGSDAAAAHQADKYAAFQRTFCPLEDGHATDRVLDLLFPPGDPAGRSTMERG
ncbi:MAG TPA: CDP-glycerol glycerophosphotransferase family protein, partial [Nocardioidaceae bacterium]|nr:CDP-glycerol glycerophosphotransferase family protein [Nocardioidaceae bacterium]